MMTDEKFYIVEDYKKIKWLTGTEFTFTIDGGFKQHAQLKVWCEENCEKVVAFLCMGGGADEYIFFFSEEDAMAFKLKWL